jgi:NAD(P)-dependent dehydrogenase (short-subunit alcohol dehydrogenase family)
MTRSIPGVAMVTGAGSGIGRAVALRLAEDGAAVGVADNRPDAVDETVEAVRQRGGRAIAVLCDVGCRESVDQAVVKIESELGPLGAQVNCAGIWQSHPLLEIDEEDWEAVMRVNATGMFFCLQAAGRVMVPRQRGVIINTSSAVGGRTGRPFHAHYAASKAAVISITRSAALAFGRHGVRVNAICPGAIDTPMFAKVAAQPEDIIAPLLARIPMGRVGQPSEVASVVSFLISDDASYVNGQALNVCGGLQMD